jgi:putative glycosyltransferase (TIGR04372 family)
VDHLLVRIGGRKVLLVDVCASADGHGVGYGIMLKRIERALQFGRAMQARVFYVREARSINAAVLQLRSPDVEILPRAGPRALCLRTLWVVTAPFRFGSPRLWVLRLLARLLLGSSYERPERSHVRPAVRRRVAGLRLFSRTLRQARLEYAKRSAAAWKEIFKRHASPRLREAERAGRLAPLRLSLPPEREPEAIARAVVLGIRPTGRLVTVHVREPGYRSIAGLRQRRLDALRNARVETYGEAFRALVERGYTVVRLGDSSMTPIEQDGVVDLATSRLRTEWLEVWCIQRSEFLIGCDSGPSWLAVLLGVPVLTVNALHFRDITRPADRVICKRARERATGRVLSIAEMLTASYGRTGLDRDRYEHLDNEPSDIAEAVIDMIDVVHGRERPSEAQRHVHDRLLALGRECRHEWTSLQGVAFIREPRGAMSRRFADKYLHAGNPESASPPEFA